VANLPEVIALLIALQRRWIVMGVTHSAEIEAKDKEIQFREQLRQETLKDIEILREDDQKKTEALRDLTDVVKQSSQLVEKLLDEALDQRWDGNERRTPRPSPRTRRGA
jgi:hypothetical protein